MIPLAGLKFTRWVLTVLFIGLLSPARSQMNPVEYAFGVGTGTMIYQGGLTPNWYGSRHNLKPSITLFASTVLDEHFSLRANYASGSISGNDAWYSSPGWRQERNFSFHSTVNELSGMLTWNVIGIPHHTDHKKLIGYLLGGAGLDFVHISRDWSHLIRSDFPASSFVITGLATDSAHRLPKILPVIPLGGGVRYNYNANFTFFGEAVYRMVLVNYMDGFHYATDPGKKEHYYSISIGISYLIRSKGIPCPN